MSGVILYIFANWLYLQLFSALPVEESEDEDEKEEQEEDEGPPGDTDFPPPGNLVWRSPPPIPKGIDFRMEGGGMIKT